MSVVNLIGVLGLGIYLRVLVREVLGLLGEKSQESLFSLMMGLAVLGWWMADNLVGLILGISVSVGYGMVLVVGMMMWSWGEMEKMKAMGSELYCGHYMVPGLRGMLALFLPFMELISVVIRPLTLSVRLSTNITSGHVLLAMTSLFAGVSFFVGVSFWAVGWVLGVLEIFVGVLQSGIFTMLVIIYMD
uniref:ATP synthase subunit a n=1 Tax=Centrorhynchus aluconis TaxID=1795424 RepID=A0A140DJ62_9BILA|nr:ATP synthase F0 subunit 6 [Centrorhynchus aluconis]